MAVARLVDARGEEEIAPERARLERELADERFFWLDLEDPSRDELATVSEVFGFHHLAIEDSLEFGQRAKLEPYDEFVFLVVFGWALDDDEPVEVHAYYSERFLVTVHRRHAPGLDAARPRCGRALGRNARPVLLLHHVVDELVESFAEPVARIDGRLEQIETDIVEAPSHAHVRSILDMRRDVARMRNAIAPERDLFGRLSAGIDEIPGMTVDAGRYFRDLYDNLYRLGERLEELRELMTSALDVYLSASSNRLGVVTKQLTVIATIFLPLTFVTGFFGQNFGWMVARVGSPAAFFVLGIGLQLAGVGAILAVFRRRGWF